MRLFRLLPVLLVLALAAPVLSEDPEPQSDSATQTQPKTDASGKDHPMVGRRVLVTKAGAELRTRKGIVWKSYFGEVFNVALVNDDWYWVQEKGGWLWKKNVVPLDDAVEKFTTDIEEEESAENFHNRGIAYYALRNYTDAIIDFDKTLSLKPQYAGAYINRGNAYRASNNLRKSLADYTTAIQLGASSFIAYNNRGMVHTEMKNLNAAMDDFNSALRINKDYAEAFNNRGVVYREMKQFQQAYADYTRALTLHPRFVEALINRGFVLKKLGKYDAALGDYSRAALISPFNPDILNDHAWMLATCPDGRFRDGQKAVLDAQKACQITKDENWHYLDTLAASYAEVGEFDKAIEKARAAIAKAPEADKQQLSQRIAFYERKEAFRETN